MGICRHIDAGLHAIAGDVGIDQVLEALLGKLSHHLVKRQTHAIAPAVHLDLTVASGNVGHQQVAKAARRDLGKAWLRYQNGTHGNALGAIPRKFIDACKRAHAAAHIDRQAIYLADRLDSARISLASGLILLERSRKIDHMEPRCALRGKLPRNRNGIVGINLAAASVAALQTNDLAANQIDSGKQNHASTSPPFMAPSTMPTKFSISRRPRAEDFSGWNWQPKTHPRCTMQAKLRV